MTLEEELKFIANHFCGMKYTVCERESGPADLIPMLHWKYKHLNAYTGMLLEGNPFEVVPHAWRKVLDDGMPDFMMLMVEGYVCPKNEEYKRGELEEDFKENPTSEVMEAITIQAVEIKTGKQMTAVISYVYDDDGLPDFRDPMIGPCEGVALEHNVPAMLKKLRDMTVNFFQDAA